MEAQLIQHLETFFGVGRVRCQHLEGGWLIEAVIPGLNAGNRPVHLQRIAQETANQFPRDWVIWKILLYASHDLRFSVEATLHTVPQQYVQGTLSVTLAGGDCFAVITEFDAEALQLGRPAQYRIEAIEFQNQHGQVIMPYDAHQRYVWLETMGMMFNIQGTQMDPQLPGHFFVDL